MAGLPTGIDRSRHNGSAVTRHMETSARLRTPVMFCRKCGAMNPGDSTFCQSCGTRFSKIGVMPIQSSEYNEEQYLREALAGKYEVIRLLGAGGMANVYFAREEALDRYVAVKVLPQAYLANKDFVERFKREAKISAQLEHPNIITIHTIGFDEGIIYFVMNHLPGGSLAEHIRGKKGLELLEIIRWGRDISKGLAYAHEHGVIHRDLKPENVMLDEKENAVVTDFGIAYAVESNRVTRTGVAVGTAAYMSPEQAAGKSIDNRSDIYSLGVLLYQMSTGTLPFSAEDPAGLMYQHVHQPPEPPVNRNPDIPVWLSETILKCLAKKPIDRFSSAYGVLDALTDGYRQFRSKAQVVSAVPGETLTSELRHLPADDLDVHDVSLLPPDTQTSKEKEPEDTISPVLSRSASMPATVLPQVPPGIQKMSPSPSLTDTPPVFIPSDVSLPDMQQPEQWRKWAIAACIAVSLLVMVLVLAWISGGPSTLRDWEWIVEPQFELARSFSEQGLAPVVDGGRYGFVNRKGDLVIESRYEDVWPFQGGYTAVREHGRWGFIGTSGEALTSMQFDSAREYRGGFVPVRAGRLWGYINAVGNYAIQPQFDDVGMLNEGVTPVLRNGKWGVINSSGILIVPSRYEDAQSASEGLLAIRQNGVWGYVNTYGDLAIEPRFEWVEPFSGGRAKVMVDGRWGYIDRTGEMVVEPVFEECTTYSEGLALVFRDGMGLYIDDQGEPISDERFDDGRSFTGGFAAVIRDNQWGYLDAGGTLAIPCKYENTRDFSEGVAAVRSDGLWGFIDTTGAYVIEPQFTDANMFSNDLAAVSLEGQWGFIRFSD